MRSLLLIIIYSQNLAVQEAHCLMLCRQWGWSWHMKSSVPLSVMVFPLSWLSIGERPLMITTEVSAMIKQPITWFISFHLSVLRELTGAVADQREGRRIFKWRQWRLCWSERPSPLISRSLPASIYASMYIHKHISGLSVCELLDTQGSMPYCLEVHGNIRRKSYAPFQGRLLLCQNKRLYYYQRPKLEAVDDVSEWKGFRVVAWKEHK